MTKDKPFRREKVSRNHLNTSPSLTFRSDITGDGCGIAAAAAAKEGREGRFTWKDASRQEEPGAVQPAAGQRGGREGVSCGGQDSTARSCSGNTRTGEKITRLK